MANIGSGFQIRVTTEQLRQTAEDTRINIKELKAQWKELMTIVKNTRFYWLGEGGEAKRQEVVTLNKDVEEMIARLGEYPVDLTKAAGIYDFAESANTTGSLSLPNNFIF